MHRDIKKTIRNSLLAVLIIVILLYSIFQAWKIIQGPVIKIYSPQNGQSYNSPLIEINGNAQNISSIFLDNRAISVSINGDFSEKLLLSPGYNIIVIKASDRFGKKTEKRLELVLKEY